MEGRGMLYYMFSKSEREKEREMLPLVLVE